MVILRPQWTALQRDVSGEAGRPKGSLSARHERAVETSRRAPAPDATTNATNRATTIAALLERFLSEVQRTGHYNWRHWREIERAIDHMTPEELDLLERTLARARRARRNRRSAAAA